MEINSPSPKKLVLQSLFMTSLISSLFGLASYLFNYSFWAAFAITAAMQFIIGYMYSTYVTSKYKREVLIAELDKLERLSTLLNCVYCNTQNIVTFLPNEVPDFTCEKCGQSNSVKLQFTVARSTNTVPNITDFDKIIKEPQSNHNIKL
jgi:hypothetical protein